MLHRRLALSPLWAAWMMMAVAPAHAAGTEVLVRVSGIAASTGEIGCALFAPGPAFPMDTSGARRVFARADAAGVACRFDDVAPGQWAVSVSHDLNGNRQVDTNLVGMPTEAWGVSNNVRPTLRAPRFDEAAFKVTGDAPVQLEVKVAR